MSQHIKLFTDGSCSGNPGPGGYGFVLEYGEHRKGGFGAAKHTTNNRMELYAVIVGLNAIKNKSIPVEVLTDSQYIAQAFEEDWITRWREKNWINSRNKEVKNRDLWESLDQLVSEFSSLHFTWVRGHNGNKGNEQADSLAREGTELALTALEYESEASQS